ncbi:MAG: AAA family ATPase, partial [Anaerolineae bacterium]|nr:AAA family ATPase [Anaerolineae bacterium]
GDLLMGLELSGTPFFDDWLHERRTYFHLKAVDVLTRLSKFYAVHHYLPEAVEVTRRLLELEPWQEEGHQQLLRLLALSGQRTAALEHYEHYRQKLVTEMDLEPEPETEELLDRIRAGDLKPSAVSPETPEKQALPRPLFERRDEYAWLINHWQGVSQSSRNKWALIKGEAGVGKTRLVEELGRHLEGQGAVLLQGRCYASSDSVTYQPIATALKQKMAHFLSQNLVVSEIWLAELAQLLPEIYDRYPDLPAPLTADRGANRYRLFEAVTVYLRAITAQGPLLLFIDDLQWVDEDTLEMLAYLIRHLNNAPLLLVGTYVPGELGNDHPLTTVRNTLYREGLVDELALERLSEAAVCHIVSEIVDHPDQAILARMLYKLSEGNPFILFESIEELQEQGLPARLSENQPVDLLAIPVGVQAMVERRLSHLTPPSRQLLSLAAVIGNAFESNLLIEASDLSKSEILDYLDDWVKRYLVKEIRRQDSDSVENVSPLPGDLFYDFSHDLIRTIIYNDLGQVRRQSLHKQVGLALEKLYAAQPAKVIEPLAHHFHRSDDSAKALSYLQQAGQHAKSLYAWPVALKRYRQATHHFENLHGDMALNTPIDVWRQRWDLLLGQAEAYHVQGQLDEQQHLLDLVNNEASQWGDDEDRMRIIVQQLLYRPPLNNPDRYRNLAEKGIALARILIDGVSENVCRQALGDLDLEAGRFDQALTHYELAMVGEALWKHPYEAAFCLIKIGKNYLMTNRFSRAYTCLQEAVAYAKAGPYPDLLIWSLIEVARVYLFAGNLDKAAETCQTALNLSHEIGFRLAIPSDLGLASYISTLRNDLEQAYTKGEQAREIAQEIGDEQIMAEVLCHLGHFHLANEDPDQALLNFEQAQKLSDGVSASRTIEALSYKALAYLAAEQPEQALSYSNQAIDRLTQRQNNVEAGQRIYLNHYRILRSMKQMAQAQVVLSQAHNLIVEQSTKLYLDDSTTSSLEAIQEDFISKLPWNREIIALTDNRLSPGQSLFNKAY